MAYKDSKSIDGEVLTIVTC